MLINVFREGFAYPPAFAAHAGAIAPGFFIDVGRCCNFRCLFCSVERATRFDPLEPVLDLVRAAGRHGLGQGFFTGGEPSIHPYLEEIMYCGNRHGVPHYGISTNAYGLTDGARVEALAGLGMKVWKLSWDDHRPAVLDRLRGHRGVTELMTTALEHIHRAPGGTVGVYQVLVAQNVAALPEMVAYLADLRATWPRLAFLIVALVKPVQDALANPEVLLDPARAVPHLREAIRVAADRGLPLALNNVPGCLLPELPDYHCSTFEHLGIYDTDTRRVDPMVFDAAPLAKGPACLACAAFERCNGYFTEYAARFGDTPYRPSGALLRAEPLPAERLEPASAAPPAAAAGPDPVEPVARALAAALPAGWRLQSCRVQDGPGPRELEATATRAPDGGAPLRVFVAPAAAGRAAYVDTGRLLVWYDGSELDAAEIGLVDAVVTYCRAEEAALVQLLG